MSNVKNLTKSNHNSKCGQSEKQKNGKKIETVAVAMGYIPAEHCVGWCVCWKGCTNFELYSQD